MRNRLVGRYALTTAAMIIAAYWSAHAQQTPGQPSETQARGPAQGRGRGPAEPPLPTPRFADGTVNFGRVPGEKGIWSVRYITNMADQMIGADGQRLAPPPPARGGGRAAGALLGGGEGGGGGRGRGGAKSEPWVPFQPWAAAVYDYNSVNQSKYDPEGYCLPPGGPRMMATPYPAEIIQLPDQKRVLMIFEGATHIWREIFMDGRPHPTGDALNPTYLGHSVGHYEGDALVVDSVGFNEATWLDYFGHPHTDQMHVVERFTRPNKGTLHFEAMVDDPGAYTKPFTVAWDIQWNGTSELTEYICQENNKYLNRLTDDFDQPLFGPPRK